jgi:aryl-alcohol dehydrogenase-like predicted oxidoreductase
MEYRRLGRTDLQVSAICLGTMTWGEQSSEADAHAQLDLALESGVSFIDTAEMYAVPTKAETYGRTEEIIGSWLAVPGRRARVVLATKVTGPGERFPYIRDGKPRLNRAHIEAAVDASLKRLRTDTIDLYQLHWPERDTEPFGPLGYRPGNDGGAVPLEETLDALDRVVRTGKVRQAGLSNETPWGTMRFMALAESGKGPRMASIQNRYSLLNRSFEVGLAEVAVREDCGLLAYSPMAGGALSGKYLDGARPAGARATLFPHFATRYFTERGIAATRDYVALARTHSLDPGQMALAFVNSRSFVTATIIGATTLEQLKSDIASIDVSLSREVLDGIERIHDANPFPCP